MPACEQNIIDVPVSASLPAATDLVLFTDPLGNSVLRTWGMVQNGATPPDELYVPTAAGDTTDNIVIGQGSFTLTTFINRRVRLYRNGILQPTIQVAGGNYYTYNMAAGTFTVAPLPGPEEIFQIQAY